MRCLIKIMTEERIAFLYKLALKTNKSGKAESLLKSYYLMRCHDISKSYGLPNKQFSTALRCEYCCTEWKDGNYETKVKPIRLSKKQRQRIRSLKDNKFNQDYVKSRRNLLQSNQLERKCLLCNHTTTITMKKPTTMELETSLKHKSNVSMEKKIKDEKIPIKPKKKELKQRNDINVYCSTKDAFSLSNNRNTISNTVKEVPKVIKNNKRKKDKFVGLCKEAVLASAKLAQAKLNENKLNIFLKPSK